MKKILTGTIRSVIITIANLCFLCGAGYLVDWGIYLYIHSRERLNKQVQTIINLMNGYKTAPVKKR